jgi:outer membrane protein assembly factor BamB
VALAIRPDGEGDVTETHVQWEAKKGAPHTPSMLVVGDEVYMVSDDGIASCLNAETGKTIWQQRVGGNYSSSLVYADGKIYLQSEDGKGVVLAPGKKFKKLAENGFGERTLASYAVGDGAIFVRTDKHLYRVENQE